MLVWVLLCVDCFGACLAHIPYVGIGSTILRVLSFEEGAFNPAAISPQPSLLTQFLLLLRCGMSA